MILPPEFLDFDIYKNIDETNVINFLLTDNHKHTLIVSLKGNTLEKEQIFLGKILKAIRHDIKSDVVLAEIEKAKTVHFQVFSKKFDLKKVILFGVSPAQLGLHFKIRQYQPLTIGKYTFLWIDALPTLMKNQSKKRLLWNNLQMMFLS